jgi:formylglycine-generating enzyme required for sulfatase activity
VTISKGFWLSQTQVTVEAWRRYRLDKNTPELPTADILGRKLNEAASGENLPRWP